MSDDEWAFLAPCLTLMREDAPQREHPLRELLNGLRYVARSGCALRMMPNDLPPWHAVHRQAQRWFARGSFEAAASDLRALLRLKQGKEPSPTAAVLEGRVLRSRPESEARAGYNGHKKTKGSKVHPAVDTLGACWPRSSPPRTSMSGRPSPSSQGSSRRRRATRSNSPTWTRATRARRWPRPPRRRASPWRSSRCPRSSGLRAAAQAMGGGALLRLVVSVQAARQGLRAAARAPGGAARRRVLHPHARVSCALAQRCVTPSRMTPDASGL